MGIFGKKKKKSKVEKPEKDLSTLAQLTANGRKPNSDEREVLDALGLEIPKEDAS